MKKFFFGILVLTSLSSLIATEARAEGFAWSVGYFRAPDSEVQGLQFQGHGGDGWGGYVALGSGRVSGRQPRGRNSEELVFAANLLEAPIREYTERNYLALGPAYALPIGERSFFSVQFGYAYYEDTSREYQESLNEDGFRYVSPERNLGGKNSLDLGVGFLLRGFYIGTSYAIDEWRVTIGGGWR